ncbi:putative disease resistance protein RGA4 [Triticum dicoccoides]|uniref:putative disease resistance protein RGA4 n=1 Tax=Triticum dicoccoides TaxID=85692 RepID=UPI00188EF50A|nr:putative disease resistance protein RGA4 [Triticum dicoccoides]
MAGVLDALASYVSNMLTEMAIEEVAMLIGVSSGIDDLSVKLRDLKNVLADADKRNITDESVREWVEELKRAMYRATDILDLCQLRVMEQGPSRDMGCLNPLLFCMRHPLHAHEIGSRIKVLNQKLDEISKRGGSFNFIKLEAYQNRKTTNPPPVNRKTNPLLERSSVVGEKIEDDTRALVHMLMMESGDKSDSIMVFAIVGVGGIGKTTLSKKVFNDEAIQDKFTTKIWLSVTQEFSEVELLQTAITSANGNLPGPGGGSQDKALLVPALASAIRDKKIFLVLDDMWGTNEWTNLLKAAFSHSAPGMKAVHPYHHVDKLEPEDAWSLLKKQVLTTEKTEPAVDMLKDIGLQIVEKCDGLPLAIKVMGGLLCQKDKERHDWEKVLHDSTWSFVGMWIGEGFVHGDSDKLEELGNEYHKELILRNLIEPDPLYSNQTICHMHDVVRSFAQFLTRDEALIGHSGEILNSKLSLPKFLRLSVETKGGQSDEFEWRCLQEQKSLRSIIIIGNFKIQSGDSLMSFSSLRTLHIESANFAALTESLYQLKHLRYLTLQNCNDINSLPEDIHKVKFLQHLGLEGCRSLVKLPDSIVKLEELRFLDLDDTCVNNMPRGFCALINLRELYGFPAYVNGDWCSLEELGPLSHLIHLGLKGLENVAVTSSALKAMLVAKVHLTLMKLHCTNTLDNNRRVPSEKEQGIIEEVFDELYPPSCIENINIQGYFGRQLPRWMMSTATSPLKSLRFLTMHELVCCTQLPDGLCLLPRLELLAVDRAPAIKRVGPEFVQSPDHRHHPSSQATTSFPRLHQMKLNALVQWEDWEWEEQVQAMPLLEELSIVRCNLRRIPPGLASHARALKKVYMSNIEGLDSVENFGSVTELRLSRMPEMTRISNLPKLQNLEISFCPKVELLEQVPALRRLVLNLWHSEKQLPLYLQAVKPSHFLLNCSRKVLTSMALGKSGSEWYKFSHIQHVEAYAKDGGNEKKWHLLYTREPYKIDTNVVQDYSNEK